jgi:uncharacterized membrane protein YqjE
MARTDPADDSARDSGSAPVSPARGAVGAVLGFARTRVSLLANEVEENLLRLLEVALWGLIGIFAIAFSMLFASILVVLLLPEAQRVAAAIALTALYVIVALAAAFVIRRRLVERPRFLSATLAELDKDRAALARAAGRGGEPRTRGGTASSPGGEPPR